VLSDAVPRLRTLNRTERNVSFFSVCLRCFWTSSVVEFVVQTLARLSAVGLFGLPSVLPSVCLSGNSIAGQACCNPRCADRKNWICNSVTRSADVEAVFHVQRAAVRQLMCNWPFLTQSPADFYKKKLGEMIDTDTAMNPQHFGSDPVDIRIRINRSGLIRKSALEFRITFGWHFGLGGVCALLAQSCW